ncbi:MAG: glutamine--fructose-6-phosphate aminotransferase, partial [Hadesarchaea archaeon]
PLALEGALKVKEISYLHAEALAGGELKHGTLALLERGTPVVAVAVPGEARGRLMSNLEEMRARGARMIVVAEEGDGESPKHADLLVRVPEAGELLSPLTFILPLQLLAYHLSVGRGLDPDRPRSLAKSVTVE